MNSLTLHRVELAQIDFAKRALDRIHVDIVAIYVDYESITDKNAYFAGLARLGVLLMRLEAADGRCLLVSIVALAVDIDSSPRVGSHSSQPGHTADVSNFHRHRSAIVA